MIPEKTTKVFISSVFFAALRMRRWGIKYNKMSAGLVDLHSNRAARRLFF